MDLLEFASSELERYKDEKHQKFSSSLTPGAKVLGVKIPKLRLIAKEIIKGDWENFLKLAPENYMEEKLLKAIVITYLKLPAPELFKLVYNFVPKISDWAVCDTFCMGLHFLKKNKEKGVKFLSPYLKSKEEFKLRFGVVCLLAHFIEEDYIDFILETFFNLKSDKYYAQMAIAWGISICYIKFPKKTLKYLKKNSLDNFTFNKSISKITDSYRVSAEDKAQLRRLRR